jgi:hypothetical protein
MACPAAGTDTIYQGTLPAGFCPTGFTYKGVSQDWFPYNDGTSDAGTQAAGQQADGCDGQMNCAYHTSGSGYTDYGAGAGITLADNAIFDASQFSGLNVYLKGFTTGTRGPGFSSLNNAVHVKFITGSSADASVDPRNGDDYGGYCPIDGGDAGGCYTLCHLPFSALTRDGFRSTDSGAPNPTTDVFDPKNLVKIQFEFSLYSAPDGGVPEPVSFDVWIDGISWFN